MIIKLTRDMIPAGPYDTLFPNFGSSVESQFITAVAQKMVGLKNESTSRLAIIANDPNNRKEDRYAAYLVLGEKQNLRGENWNWTQEADIWVANNVGAESNISTWVDDRLDVVNNAFTNDPSDLEEAIRAFSTVGGGVGPIVGSAISAYSGSLISVFFPDKINSVPQYLQVGRGQIIVPEAGGNSSGGPPNFVAPDPQGPPERQDMDSRRPRSDRRRNGASGDGGLSTTAIVLTTVGLVGIIGLGIYLQRKTRNL